MTNKTIIGVLSGHEEPSRNNSLVLLLNKAFSDPVIRKELMDHYQFVFTGGTFKRCIAGDSGTGWKSIDPKYRDDISSMSTVLPGYLKGGVILLSYLVVQRKCRILWSFLSDTATTLQNPDNGALMRLCDICHTKKLMNTGSVERWLQKEMRVDWQGAGFPSPVDIAVERTGIPFERKTFEHGGVAADTIMFKQDSFSYPSCVKDRVLALIAHDGMKDRMVDFVIDFDRQLSEYKAILATGTTGALLARSTRYMGEKVHRYYSGPKGGDIEIATEILAGSCHDVVFFIDPVNPHPHMDDIRVVIGSCMIQEYVQMVTNENHARSWMASMNCDAG